MYTVHCTLYSVHCTMYNIHCTMYTVQCTLYNVHCTMYTVQCTLYSVVYTERSIVVCSTSAITSRSIELLEYLNSCKGILGELGRGELFSERGNSEHPTLERSIGCNRAYCTVYMELMKRDLCTVHSVHCTLYTIHYTLYVGTNGSNQYVDPQVVLPPANQVGVVDVTLHHVGFGGLGF